jgi:glycosyltransferase involved in cell wall biosynthesis
MTKDGYSGQIQEDKLKIFIGPTEISNMGAILADTFKKRGLKVTAVSIGMGPFQEGMRYDKILAPDIRHSNKFQKIFRYLYCWLYCFVRYFPTHNVFIFMFGDTLLPFNLDLPILKLFRKVTIMRFVGSDIRYYEAVQAAANEAGLNYDADKERLRKEEKEAAKILKRKKRMIHMVEKYATHIISGPAFSQLLTRPYLRIAVPLDIANLKYNNRPNRRPIVVHAPSKAAVKGTAYVIEAVEQLKKERYDFEFRLLTDTSNIEVRRALSEADIAVDQLFAFGAGMLALEAMAAGCAVLGGNKPEFSGFPTELPVVHTDPATIYRNLKMLLDNPDLRLELGAKGRKYVGKYHDSRKITGEYIKLITKGKAGIFYYPLQESAV